MIHEGWKFVPMEATAEMVQAAEDRHVEGASYIAENSIQFALWREVWRAMLAVAPQPNAAPQAPCIARSDSPEVQSATPAAPTPAADQPPPVGQPGKSTGGDDRLPAQPAAERCAVKDGEEQCTNTAAGGLRVNFFATPTIQKRYGRRVMLSLVFDLPICLACFPKVTPANVMTDEQWREFARVAHQLNSGILADREQTEITLCAFEDPQYVALRGEIARAANDSQPGPSGPTRRTLGW